MEGYDYDRCDTFQDLVHFLMNEDSLIPEDGGDVDFEIVRGGLTKNHSNSQAHESVTITSDQQTTEHQSNSPVAQNVEKEMKRLKTNEKAREKRKTQKQKVEELLNKEISLEEEKSSLLARIDKIEKEKTEILNRMSCLLYTSPSPRDRG